MKRLAVVMLTATIAAAAPANANDWQKFYRAVIDVRSMPRHQGSPEVLPFDGDGEALITRMWDEGYVMVGFTSFNTSNASTKDGVRLAKKLGVPRVAIGTHLESSSVGMLPWSSPTTTTSTTSGTVNGPYGRTATFGATTTTQGSQTTYIPFEVNRFSKIGIYFHHAPQIGLGILTRAPTEREIARHETRRLVIVRAVRRGSPAYSADLLPGDVILRINSQSADDAAMRAFANLPGEKVAKLDIWRNGAMRHLSVPVSSDWAPPVGR